MSRNKVPSKTTTMPCPTWCASTHDVPRDPSDTWHELVLARIDDDEVAWYALEGQEPTIGAWIGGERVWEMGDPMPTDRPTQQRLYDLLRIGLAHLKRLMDNLAVSA